MDTARRYLSSLRSYAGRHREVRTWGIGPNDLVADIGSGQAPHPRANVLCDKFATDNTERAVHASLVADRPLIITDATKTPFPDKSLDFVICRHLLEHMADPAALLNELGRIGSAGYIETPSRVYEKLHGWDFHRWFVDIRDGRLRLESKDRLIFDEDLHSWFTTGLEHPPFWRFFIPRAMSQGLMTSIVWSGNVAYEIVGEAHEDEVFVASSLGSQPADQPYSSSRLTTSQAVRSKLDAFGRRKSDRRVIQLLDELQCVDCRAPLRRGPGQEFECESCSRIFPLTSNGVETIALGL